MKGKVFDIKKFAIHDGPGIRSTLFLKGCPLKCIWCHNPEGIENKISLWYFPNKCIHCRSCIQVCPNKALSLGNEGEPFILINHQLCDNKGACVDACPTKALTFDSYELEVEEAVKRLLQDQIFYEQSGGGITISGGDPLFQHEYSKSILKICHDKGIHTSIETCMYARKEIFASFFDIVDLFIVDLKFIDEHSHRKYTGTGNSLILSNFKSLMEAKQNVLVRIPLIPEITATEENISAIARYVKEVAPETEIELINFNPLAENKYRLMGKEYAFLSEMKPFTQNELDDFYTILEKIGIRVVKETAVS